jgi:hypothetical protein
MHKDRTTGPGGHPSAGTSALSRHIARNPNGRAARSVQQVGVRGSKSAHTATRQNALSRQIARNPAGKAAQRFAKLTTATSGLSTNRRTKTSIAGGHSRAQASSRGKTGHTRSAALTNLLKDKPSSLAAQRWAQAHATKGQSIRGTPGGAAGLTQPSGGGWHGARHHRRRWLYPAFGGTPYSDRIDADDSGAPDTSAPDTAGPPGASGTAPASTAADPAGGLGSSRVSSAKEPVAIDWQPPIAFDDAIGQPGAGVFIVERADDNGTSLPVHVGSAPDGFGARLQYVMDDMGGRGDEQDRNSFRVRLGIVPVRQRNPADRALLRALAHDIVARVRGNVGDETLAHQSTPTDRERRLLEQRGVQHSGDVADYLNA